MEEHFSHESKMDFIAFVDLCQKAQSNDKNKLEDNLHFAAWYDSVHAEIYTNIYQKINT